MTKLYRDGDSSAHTFEHPTETQIADAVADALARLFPGHGFACEVDLQRGWLDVFRTSSSRISVAIEVAAGPRLELPESAEQCATMPLAVDAVANGIDATFDDLDRHTKGST